MEYDRYEKIIELCSAYGVDLEPQGALMVGRCPIHHEKSASFKIRPEGTFKCYGCGESGDAIALYMLLYDCDFLEAKKGLGLWEDRSDQPKVKKVYVPPPRFWPYKLAVEGKKEAYIAARDSLLDGYDTVIVYKGQNYWNHLFLAKCLRGVEDEYKLVHELYRKLCVKAGKYRAHLFLESVFKE